MKKSVMFFCRVLLCLLTAATCTCLPGEGFFAVAQEADTAETIHVPVFAGMGTEKEPYLIETLDDLKQLRDDVDGGITYEGVYFAQTADIVFPDGENWDPVGNVEDGTAFCGVYDGCGHILENIYCENVHASLFALLRGEVRNLGIESGYFKGGFIGSIASHGGGANARIVNCYNKAKVTASGRAGGLTDNFGGQILFCWNFGEISGTHDGVAAAGISSSGGTQIQHCWTLDEAPVVAANFGGHLTFSELISPNQIDEKLDENHRQMLAWEGSLKFTTENTVFLAVDDGDVVFRHAYIPEAYLEAIAAEEARLAKMWETIKNKYSFTGSGTEEDPFLIEDYEDLAHMRDCVDLGVTYEGYYFAQTADIVFPDEENWNPIGNLSENLAFKGVYDGQGRVIENIYCKNSYAGLFSLLKGEVRNLGIESGEFIGDFIGAITSHGEGKILNCYNKASVTGSGRAGGIADYFGGDILFCWNFGDMSRSSGVIGGIISYNANRLANCYCVDSMAFAATFNGKIIDCLTIEEKMVDAALIDAHNIALFKGNAEEINGVNYICLADSGIGFCEKDAFPEEVLPLLQEAFVAEYGVIILLSIITVLFLVFASMKLNKLGKVDKEAEVVRVEKKNVEDTSATTEPKKKATKSLIAGTVLFWVFAIAGLSICNSTLSLKRWDGINAPRAFYAQEQDTIDVLFVGSSMLGHNLDLETMWSANGISGYALWGGHQTFWNSYYYLRDAIKYNEPKVVVLDVTTAKNQSIYLDDAYQYANVTGLKFSENKLEAVRVSSPQERWLEVLFGFPIYHTRYSEVAGWDFTRYIWDNASLASNKGFHPRLYGTTTLKDYGDANGIDTVYAISDKQEYYLRAFIELCQERNMPVLLVATPNTDRARIQPYLNYAQHIADEYEVPFINYNLLDEETGFVISDVYKDNSHINVSGAQKISRHLSNYLAENYELEDHRDDERYESWEQFAHIIQNDHYGTLSNRSDYINELARNDRTIAFIKWGTVKDTELEVLQEQMESAGLDAEFLTDAETGCWLMESTYQSDEVEAFEFEDFRCAFQLDAREFMVDLYDNMSISYDGKRIDTMKNGVMCVVYDSYTQQIVDTYKLY